jgi:hypothetical protein
MFRSYDHHKVKTYTAEINKTDNNNNNNNNNNNKTIHRGTHAVTSEKPL